jgi:uncharacterized cupredoxin-like copper-binding protein
MTMTDDMRFTPTIPGEAGRNRAPARGQQGPGHARAVLGTRDSLDEHAQMMLKYPGMEHAEPYMAHVAPGQTEDWSGASTAQAASTSPA